MYHFGFEEVIHPITSQNVWEENNSLQEKKEGNVGWCPRIWAREAGACSTTGPRESAPRLVGNQPHILLTSSSSPSSPPSRSSGPPSRSLSPSQSSGRSPWVKLPILDQVFLADVSYWAPSGDLEIGLVWVNLSYTIAPALRSVEILFKLNQTNADWFSVLLKMMSDVFRSSVDVSRCSLMF